MDTMNGQGGIQMLLTAEQETQKIISNARNFRTTRLKQAKEEAEKDAATYRAQLETEYQKRVSENNGYSGSNVKRLEEETEMKIRDLKSKTGSISPDVVSMMMKYVMTVKK